MVSNSNLFVQADQFKEKMLHWAKNWQKALKLCLFKSKFINSVIEMDAGRV
jgi:hypothetical protein